MCDLTKLCFFQMKYPIYIQSNKFKVFVKNVRFYGFRTCSGTYISEMNSFNRTLSQNESFLIWPFYEERKSYFFLFTILPKGAFSIQERLKFRITFWQFHQIEHPLYNALKDYTLNLQEMWGFFTYFLSEINLILTKHMKKL